MATFVRIGAIGRGRGVVGGLAALLACLALSASGQEFSPPAGDNITEQAAVPLEFSLRGALPNPFNMSTTIEYSTANEGDVSLVIYNSLGQKVRELVSEALAAGMHRRVPDECHV